jgi:hypothetical protein
MKTHHTFTKNGKHVRITYNGFVAAPVLGTFVGAHNDDETAIFGKVSDIVTTYTSVGEIVHSIILA